MIKQTFVHRIVGVTPHRLFAAQILAHLSIIPMLAYGHWWQWLVAIFVYFINGCLGMTMTYHRLLSHKCWSPPRWMEQLFTLFATIGLTGPAISWVAIHRKHHAFTDTPNDPHSPKYIGWFRAHFMTMYAKVDIKYAAHLLRDPFYVWQHDYYLVINIAYGMVLYMLDPMAVVYAWLLPAAILWNAGSTIVSTSHRDGSAHNDDILGWLVWGEGWHTNHHARPADQRWHKYDIGGIIIESIEKNLKTRTVV